MVRNATAILLISVSVLRCQVEGHPNKAVLLESARRLRLEKDREQELANQKLEQEQAIGRADQRLARLQGQLKDLRSASMGTTPEGETRLRRASGHLRNKRLSDGINTREAAMRISMAGRIITIELD